MVDLAVQAVNKAGNFMTKKEVPIWEKYMLTVEEAAAYYNIGINYLSMFAKNNSNENFLFWKGNRPQFKRVLFNEYLDRCNIL